MPRIIKDYSNRSRKTVVNHAPNIQQDEANLAGTKGSGTHASHTEAMINHQKAVLDRAKRSIVPNGKLRAK
jgi:hypothetical protein